MKRKYSRIRALLLDAAAAGVALVVFALFHHVLPREQQALNLQTVNTAQVAWAAVETAAPQVIAETTEAPVITEATETFETPVITGATETADAAETFHPTDRTTASAGKSDSGSRGNPGKGSRSRNSRAA